jgi:hypothetical protein
MVQTTITPEELMALKNRHGLQILHTVGFNHLRLSTIIGDGIGERVEENPNYDQDYPSLDFVFKKVGFDVLSASAVLGQDNPVKAIKMQMESCLLWGDKEALFNVQDATVFTSVMEQFVKITSSRSASLKKN